MELRSKIPFYRRLSLRLALVMMVSILLFERAHQGIMGLLVRSEPGIVEVDTGDGEIEFVTASGPMIMDALPFGGGPLHDLRQDLSEDLALPQIEARLAELEASGWSMAWLSPSLEVLARSPSFDSSASFDSEPSGPLGLTFLPVHKDGRLQGWVAGRSTFIEMALPSEGRIHVERPGSGPAERGEPRIFSDFGDLPVPPAIRRLARWDRGLQGVAWVAVALVLSLFVSRWVTRRLDSLARAAAAAGETDFDPETLEISGRDEVAMLASTLKGAWRRNQDLVADLADRDRRRREWIARVSHDLRTPLTALMVCLDGAGRRVVDGGNKDAELRRLLGVAQQDAERVMSLAENLLEIARLDTESPLRLEPVLPAELVERVTGLLQPLAAERGLQLEAVVTSPLPELYADGHRLLRALENVVQNALRHARRRVEVVARALDGVVELEVLDDGPGFVALGTSQDPPLDDAPSDGTRGLGLQILRRTIEAHGGRVELSNRESGGARVLMTLPRDGEDSPA